MYYGLFYLTAKAGVIRDVSSHTEVALFYLCRADGEEWTSDTDTNLGANNGDTGISNLTAASTVQLYVVNKIWLSIQLQVITKLYVGLRTILYGKIE